MATDIDALTSGMRAAVKQRLDATPADDHKMQGYVPTESCCDGGKCHSAAQFWKEMTQASAKKYSAVSGTTAKFGTGAVRSSTFEEFRYDLVSPIGLREVARACAEGAEKYGDWNWEKGMPVHDLLNHAIAHIYSFLAGDRSEPHLGHAAWNLMSAIHSNEIWPDMNQGTLRGPGCKAPSDDK